MFQLLVSRANTLGQRRATRGDLFFDFLVGLPGVQVGGQARADDSHEEGQELGVELDGRYERADQHRPELWLGKHGRGHVSQQRQRQPAERIANERVRAKELQRDNDQGGGDDDHLERNGDQHVQRGGYAAQVRAGLDGVADQHADERRVQDPARVEVTDRVEQAAA